VFEIKGRRLYFQHRHIDFDKLQPGDRVWKTDDPALNKRLQQSFAGNIAPRGRVTVDLRVSGRAGEPMQVESNIANRDCALHVACSTQTLEAARTAPLTTEKLRAH